METKSRRRRIGLEVRLVLALLLIALVPLAVSAVLIDQIAQVAQNFASHHVAKLRPHLEGGEETYRELIDAKKALYREIARRLSASDAAREIAGGAAGQEEASPLLERMLEASPDLLAVAVAGPRGEVLAKKRRPRPASGIEDYRALEIKEPIPRTDGELRLTFAADLGVVAKMRALAGALRESRRVDMIEDSLPAGYRATFLVLVGGVVVLVTLIGLALARRITRRVATLVTGTREIASGNLAARVPVEGPDELAELAAAFNRMVGELEEGQRKIKYLERIGAWQDVARKLAHEIKNPLTPIRLTVQELRSKYDGEDERFERLLRDTEEIVSEEIDALGRLVDAFSALGRLPRVDPQPLDLATVADDLRRDPNLASALEVRPPAEAVTVRGDRLLLRRVLANLVENGKQAGGEDGRVVLSWDTGEEDATAVVTVDDEGPGVPAKERERIFEPYVTTKETGTGLGLAICKKIAIEHRGALEVAAEPAPTGGARFVLTVPLAKSDRK